VTFGACGGDAPPHILRVGEFELVDHRAQPFGSRDLAGHVWVVNFIFTTCTDICPLSSSQMANLQRRLPDPSIRFVSISVDPEVDSPAALAAYSQAFMDDSGRWVFLSGSSSAVRSVVRERLRVDPGERIARSGAGGDADGYTIAHSRSFLLVDREGVLRGTYTMDGEGQARLQRDALALLQER
jgi:protein SCO1/2